MWRQNKTWRVKSRHWCHEKRLDSLFQKTPIITPKKNEPFSQEMHMKIPLLSRGLKLMSSKAGCKVSALHFSVKLIPQMAFWHRANSDGCFFIFLSQDEPVFHRWKANRGLKLSRILRTTENDHLHIYSLISMVWRWLFQRWVLFLVLQKIMAQTGLPKLLTEISLRLTREDVKENEINAIRERVMPEVDVDSFKLLYKRFGLLLKVCYIFIPRWTSAVDSSRWIATVWLCSYFVRRIYRPPTWVMPSWTPTWLRWWRRRTADWVSMTLG